MTDLRSGLCHGPYCTHPITGSSPSEDFCGDSCQTAWNALHAHPPMPPLSVNLPGPSLARWTPEGGAPVTPETSTWEPRTGVEPVGEWLDEAAGWLEANAGVQLEPWQRTVFAQALQAETETLIAASVTPTPPTLHRAPGEATTRLRPGDRISVSEVDGEWQYRLVEPSAKPPTDTSWIKTCETSPKRSWFSRLWKWMWLRG